MKSGIPSTSMVRLGRKSTDKTKSLNLFNQVSTNYRRSRDTWNVVNGLKVRAATLEKRLKSAFDRYTTATVNHRDIMEYLEIPDDGTDPAFFEAFTIPADQNGMTRVGRKGRAVDKFYLLDRWMRNENAGIFTGAISERTRSVWEMSPHARAAARDRWRVEVLKDMVSETYEIAEEFNQCQQRLQQLNDERNTHIICEKRIVGCTTTGAAKYASDVQTAAPDVLLVEEAGEILESHILTAMSPKTKQLILIGDHKQLRPKVSNHNLSVEKGQGYDLNRSLFERLVLKGFPHTTLSQQHRMRPEISDLVRQLTYPELVDAPTTRDRKNLRGFQGNLIFVHHTHPEDENPKLASDLGFASSSKQNIFEAQMVLKCVKYLGQQGYGTDKIVVLTPYLGQLQLLKKVLGQDNDPILNDLDSHELVRAGLVSAATARLSKNPIRIATIGGTSSCHDYLFGPMLTSCYRQLPGRREPDRYRNSHSQQRGP
jgi:hypothetical protein